MVLVPSDAFFEAIHRKSSPSSSSSSSLPSFLHSVCRRCLFGPVDHQQTKTDLQALNERLLNEAGQRWNFDFLVGEPAHGGGGGRFDWFPVDSKKIHVIGEEGSRLDAAGVPCAVLYPNQISKDCDTATTTADLNNRCSIIRRPYFNPSHTNQVPVSDVTSRLTAPVDVTAPRDLDSDVIDSCDVSRDVDRAKKTGSHVTRRRSASTSGTVRRKKARTKTTMQKLVRTLAAQGSAITDYFPKSKSSAMENKLVESRQQRLDTNSSL